jgi:hypothetical protein
MEDKTMEKWEITVGAGYLISKLIVSCHELSLDQKSATLVCKVVKGESICEVDFFQADKMGLYDNLVKTAKLLGKNVIDKEIVIKYFGGRAHEKSALDEAAIDIEQFSLPLQKLLLAHILIPLKIIGKDENGLIAEYENDGKRVRFEGVLLFKEDESRDLSGKIVLFHYAPVVMADPGKELVAYLLDEQKKCNGFMKALANLDGQTIEVDKFSKAIKRTMLLMEL